MENDINLIPQKKQQTAKEKKNISIYTVVSVISVSLVFLTSALIFFMKATSPLSTLEKQKETTLASIQAMQTKFIKYTLLTKKIDTIVALINNRSHFDETIGSVQEVIPSNISVNSLSLDKKQLRLELQTTSLSAMNEFIDSMTSLASEKKLVKNISMDGLSLNPDKSEYIFIFSADVL